MRQSRHFVAFAFVWCTLDFSPVKVAGTSLHLNEAIGNKYHSVNNIEHSDPRSEYMLLRVPRPDANQFLLDRQGGAGYDQCCQPQQQPIDPLALISLLGLGLLGALLFIYINSNNNTTTTRRPGRRDLSSRSKAELADHGKTIN